MGKLDMRQRLGFTLIEMVMVMVVISAGALMLTSLFGHSFNSLTLNETQQQASQHAQECAEKVLSDRRNIGASAVSSSMCDSLPAASGFTRTMSISANTTAACPSGASCNNAVITLTSTTTPSVSSTITIMLTN